MLHTRRLFLFVASAAAASAVACSRTPEPVEAPGGPSPAPAAVAKEAASSVEGLPAPFDLTYGVYLNQAKVGWMRSAMTVGAQVSFAVEVEAVVSGMGKASKLRLTERRSYALDTRLLQFLEFEQKAATGAVQVSGRRLGEEFELTIRAGGAVRTQRLPVQESLDDALAVVALSRQAQLGAGRTASHFDASVQRSLKVEHRVAAIETRLFGGVETRTVKLESRYPDTGIVEVKWVDDAGMILESQVGGFFVARLEPPEVAKKRDYQHDMLVSNAVRTPRPLGDAQSRERLEVTFSGFGEMLPPSSPTQTVKREGSHVALSLSRGPALPDIPVRSKVGSELLEWVQPTPFIQSDASDIRAAALAAVEGATSFRDQVTRLVAFVRQHINAEYVPAYSNALEAFRSRRGDCTEHAILFVALERALQIPSRVAVGIAYSAAVDGFGWHAWAEVHAEGRWYSTDPMWGQPVADATHIKLAGGGPLEQARIIMLLGKLQVVAL